MFLGLNSRFLLVMLVGWFFYLLGLKLGGRSRVWGGSREFVFFLVVFVVGKDGEEERERCYLYVICGFSG